jgi:hypothetical protein
MQSDTMIRVPRHLSDEDLVMAVTRLVGCERETMASLIAHLMEFDVRRLYLGAGCPSMFVYCTDVLWLSGMRRTTVSRRLGWPESSRSCCACSQTGR